MNLKRNRNDFFIPLSSMSDIAFLLLIFIMLVALMNYRREVKIDYPEGNTTQKVSDKNNLEIWVDRFGNTYLDGLPCTLRAIEDTVGDLYRTAPDTRLHIIADRNTPFKEVHKVLEILQLLQYRVVSFVVKDA